MPGHVSETGTSETDPLALLPSVAWLSLGPLPAVVREKTHLPPWPEGREDGSSTDSTGGEEGRTTGEANTQGSCVEVSYSTASSDAASPVEIRDSKGRAYRGLVSELGPCSAQRRLLKVNLEP